MLGDIHEVFARSCDQVYWAYSHFTNDIFVVQAVVMTMCLVKMLFSQGII